MWEASLIGVPDKLLPAIVEIFERDLSQSKDVGNFLGTMIERVRFIEKFIRNFSIVLLFVSLFYVAHIIYFTQNGILVGTYVVENNNHELQVVKLSKSTYGKYMGLKEGDRIIEISGKIPTEENIKVNI